MDHAGLDHRVRPGGLHRLGETSKTVAAHDQYVHHSPVGQVGAHVRPKRGGLVSLDPDAQHMLDAIHVHSHGDVRGPVGDLVIGADLDTDRIEVDHRVELLQRA